MLAQVTYVQKFIMADSEDEFMPIFLLKVPLLWQTTQNICVRVSAGRQYQTYLIPPADVVRASARRTTPGRCHDFWNPHNRCPADAPRRPAMLNRPAGRLSEFLVNRRVFDINHTT